MGRAGLLFLIMCIVVIPGFSQEEPQISTATAPAVPSENSSSAPGTNAVRTEQANGQRPARYTIYRVWLWQETGDCLWTIAKKYYGDPWLWKKIYLANRDRISDPRVIYPKQELIIPELDASEK